MTFLITLIALLMERFFHWHHLRHWRWFLKYEHWLSLHISGLPSKARFLINLLPVVVFVGLITWLIDGWVYGMVEFIFSVLVLLYCLGPDNLWVQVYKTIGDMDKEDPTLVIERAQNDFGLPKPDNPQQFHQTFVRGIFIAAHERIFSVIFWFVILGPMGAVLYRLTELFAVRNELGLDHIASRFKAVLDWLPVRIFAFLFALGGHFSEVFDCYKKGVGKGLEANESFLADCGVAALDVTEGGIMPETGAAEKEALELLDRVFVMWLVILAVIVLIT